MFDTGKDVSSDTKRSSQEWVTGQPGLGGQFWTRG